MPGDVQIPLQTETYLSRMTLCAGGRSQITLAIFKDFLTTHLPKSLQSYTTKLAIFQNFGPHTHLDLQT